MRFEQRKDLWLPAEEAETSTTAAASPSPTLESMVETLQTIEPLPPSPEFIFKGSRERFLEAFQAMVGKVVEEQPSGVLPLGQPSSIWSGVTVHFCPPDFGQLIGAVENASDTLTTVLLSEKQVRRLRWYEHASHARLFPTGRKLRKCQLRRITKRCQADKKRWGL